MAKQAQKQTVENPRVFKKPNEVTLVDREVSAHYVLNRLRTNQDPVIIKCVLKNTSDYEVASLFGKIVDTIKADLWLKHALLFIDLPNLRITFHNECVVHFKRI